MASSYAAWYVCITIGVMRNKRFLLAIAHASKADDVYNGYFIPAGVSIRFLHAGTVRECSGTGSIISPNVW